MNLVKIFNDINNDSITEITDISKFLIYVKHLFINSSRLKIDKTKIKNYFKKNIENLIENNKTENEHYILETCLILKCKFNRSLILSIVLDDSKYQYTINELNIDEKLENILYTIKKIIDLITLLSYDKNYYNIIFKYQFLLNSSLDLDVDKTIETIVEEMIKLDELEYTFSDMTCYIASILTKVKSEKATFEIIKHLHTFDYEFNYAFENFYDGDINELKNHNEISCFFEDF